VRKERQKRFPLYQEWIECEELSLKNSHRQVESLWVRIRDQGKEGNLVVCICYRLSSQGERIHEVFLLLLQKSLCSQPLILLGEFNHLNICWKSSTARCTQSRKLLESLEVNFLSQVIDSPTRGGVTLDL